MAAGTINVLNTLSFESDFEFTHFGCTGTFNGVATVCTYFQNVPVNYYASWANATSDDNYGLHIQQVGASWVVANWVPAPGNYYLASQDKELVVVEWTNFPDQPPSETKFGFPPRPFTNAQSAK